MIITRFPYFLIFFIFSLLFVGCVGSNSTPIQVLQSKLQGEKEYSIILSDMKEEGNFFPNHYHQYQVDVGENSEKKPFQIVTDSYYKKYQPYCKYSIFGTKTGRLINIPGSFPILTMDKDFRKIVEPTNDWFVVGI